MSLIAPPAMAISKHCLSAHDLPWCPAGQIEFSPFLLAAYDADTETYPDLCRCMSGFTDAGSCWQQQRVSVPVPCLGALRQRPSSAPEPSARCGLSPWSEVWPWKIYWQVASCRGGRACFKGCIMQFSVNTDQSMVCVAVNSLKNLPVRSGLFLLSNDGILHTAFA